MTTFLGAGLTVLCNPECAIYVDLYHPLVLGSRTRALILTSNSLYNSQYRLRPRSCANSPYLKIHWHHVPVSGTGFHVRHCSGWKPAPAFRMPNPLLSFDQP
jgi:hypothetical protein